MWAMSGALVLVGDSSASTGPWLRPYRLAPTSLAARTGTAPRYVREWGAAQAAGSAASNLTGHLYTNPKMFTHTEADRAGFRFCDIESMFIVSGAARATSTLAMWVLGVRIGGCGVTI